MKKLNTYVLFFICFIFISIFTTACDDTNNIVDLDNKVIPSTNVSYSQYIQPVFDLKCNSAGCHNDRDQAGSLSLSSYSNTTSNFLIVAPGSPDNSKLVWSVEGSSVYPMPPIGYTPLTKNQIVGIRTWIKEGAKNN